MKMSYRFYDDNVLYDGNVLSSYVYVVSIDT